jgi:hypothetical protein
MLASACPPSSMPCSSPKAVARISSGNRTPTTAYAGITMANTTPIEKYPAAAQ